MNRRPIRAELGTGFWKILCSPCDVKQKIDFIKEANVAKVLWKDELKICDAILEQYELTSTIDLELALKMKNMYCPILNNTFKEEELLFECEKFIASRQTTNFNKQVINGVKEADSNYFTRQNTAFFLNKYAHIIGVEKNTDLNTFLSSFNQNSADDIISSNNEFVDKCLKGGLKNGKVTTIVGVPSNLLRSLWALNMALKALKQYMNVLYVTLGTSEQEVNKRFILCHSYDTKFKTELISSDEIDDVYDMELVEEVCKDFHENYSSHLIVLDDNDLDISTVTSLQKLFVFAEHKFHEDNGHGIDLIIIDDFTNMKLDDGKKLITNKNQIQTEYYSFFRNQSKNFLGTQRMIPIVVTNEIDRKYASYLEYNDTFQMTMISDVIESLSDNILVIRSDNNFQAKVTIVKPVRSADGAYYLTSVKTCLNNWYMGYNNEDENLKARARELFDDDSKTTDACLPVSADVKQEDNSSNSTDLSEEDPFGDSNNDWATPEQIKQEILKKDNKEENSYEQ